MLFSAAKSVVLCYMAIDIAFMISATPCRHLDNVTSRVALLFQSEHKLLENRELVTCDLCPRGV